MRNGFKLVEVEVTNKDDAEELLEEYNKIRRHFVDSGGNEHGYTIVAQIFGQNDSTTKYFLTGRVLDVEESKAFAEILAKKSAKKIIP